MSDNIEQSGITYVPIQQNDLKHITADFSGTFKKPIKKFYVRSIPVDHHIELVFDENVVSVSDVFIRSNIDGQEYYEVSFFKNNVVIPANEMRFTKIKLYSYPKYDVSQRQPIDYYVEYRGLLLTPVQYHDCAVGRKFYLNEERLESKGFPGANNILMFASDMGINRYAN